MNCSAWNGINSKHEPDQRREAGVWGARERNLGSSEFLGQCPPRESICVKKFVAGKMFPGESLSPGECVHGRLSLENMSQGECFPGNPHPSGAVSLLPLAQVPWDLFHMGTVTPTLDTDALDGLNSLELEAPQTHRKRPLSKVASVRL